MMIPISKILLTDSRTESYNLYDLDTHKVSNWTIGNIKKALIAGRDIRGLTGRNLRLNYYFSNIGIAGEKLDERQHYTVVKRNVYSKVIRFILVDLIGKDYEFEKSELIQLIKNGANVAGIRLDRDTLKVSHSIDTEVFR